MDSDIITVRELAAYLKITEKTAYRLAAEGKTRRLWNAKGKQEFRIHHRYDAHRHNIFCADWSLMRKVTPSPALP